MDVVIGGVWRYLMARGVFILPEVILAFFFKCLKKDYEVNIALNLYT